MEYAKTLGKLKDSGYRTRSVKDELRSNLIKKLRVGENFSRDRWLRRHRYPAAGQRRPGATQPHFARSARPGEKQDNSSTDGTAG